MTLELAGVPVIVSRTGYTGEEVGFELFVHPDDASTIWNGLLQKGQEFGLKPAGLAARDSARTEAGFPLYGHELAGPWRISSTAAGYGAFVKFHKPFFIGRRAYMEREVTRSQEIVRFRMNERGVRMARQGDPVVSRRGVVIGTVTSCVLIEGYQHGLAYVDQKYASPGMPIGVLPLPRDGQTMATKPLQELSLGDQFPLDLEATVIDRFYRRQEAPQTAGQG
jgi:glycine hydroxymethyltransferase